MKNMKTYIKKFLICLFILALPHINSTSKAMDEEREKQNCEHCSGLRQNCLKVKDNGHGATGKWLDDKTPKRGWLCHGAIDLGSAMQECYMCGRNLRYAHRVTHGNLDVYVGCTCAAYMTGELDTEEEVTKLISAGKKREREVKKKDIPLSKKKNKIQLNDSDESSDDSNDSDSSSDDSNDSDSSYGDSNDSDSNYDDDNDD